jgi:hypothetical protein
MEPAAAKQFLISKVIDEAAFEHMSLSEVERKMLYFTEQHPTTPDILDVAAKFESECDSDEYEEKVVALLKNARSRDKLQSPTLERQWKDAIDALKNEDHYILVMVYVAFSDSRKAILPTHWVRDYLLYVGIGLAVVFAAIGFAIWTDHR